MAKPRSRATRSAQSLWKNVPKVLSRWQAAIDSDRALQQLIDQVIYSVEHNHIFHPELKIPVYFADEIPQFENRNNNSEWVQNVNVYRAKNADRCVLLSSYDRHLNCRHHAGHLLFRKLIEILQQRYEHFYLKNTPDISRRKGKEALTKWRKGVASNCIHQNSIRLTSEMTKTQQLLSSVISMMYFDEAEAQGDRAYTFLLASKGWVNCTNSSTKGFSLVGGEKLVEERVISPAFVPQNLEISPSRLPNWYAEREIVELVIPALIDRSASHFPDDLTKVHDSFTLDNGAELYCISDPESSFTMPRFRVVVLK